MEEAMTTPKFRSLTFMISLATLVVASTSAGAQPTYKHKAHANQIASIPLSATALVPSPAAAAVRTHEADGLSRDADDCAKYGCIDH
jgi:hypothetical protein